MKRDESDASPIAKPPRRHWGQDSDIGSAAHTQQSPLTIDLMETIHQQWAAVPYGGCEFKSTSFRDDVTVCFEK